MQQEDIIQAIVIADTYNNNFYPITRNKPMSFLPVVGVPLIEHVLNSLAQSGVNETILFCVFHANLVKDYVKRGIESKAEWSLSMEVQVIMSETCRTMGDAMRELDAKALVRGYFVLAGINTISNVQLVPLLEHHKQICKKDKGAVMTLLYKEVAWGHQLISPDDSIVLATDGRTNRVLFHQRQTKRNKESRHVSIPLEIMLSHSEVELHRNVVSTNLSICSPSVLPLFADNFDFQTIDDFVKGILMNEEILASTLYCSMLKGSEYAANISNWHNYQTISRDIIHNWAYPLTINSSSPQHQQKYLLFGDHIYKNKNSTLSRSCILGEDIVIGENCVIEDGNKLTKTVLGENCHIGKDVTISESFIMSGTIIKENCTIIKSFVGENCVINERVVLKEGTVIGPGVIVKSGAELKGQIVTDNEEEEATTPMSETTDWDKESVDLEEMRDVVGFSTTWSETDSDYSSTSSEQDSLSESPVPEDSNIFLQEVIDSLARGYEEKLNCDYLILEINSSRYAYNMSLNEVNFFVVRAIMSLPILGESKNVILAIKDVFKYFRPILHNYIKTPDSVADCLRAIEESCLKCLWLDGRAGQIIQLLYASDITDEDSLTQWYGDLKQNNSVLAEQQSLVKFFEWLQQASEESDDSD